MKQTKLAMGLLLLALAAWGGAAVATFVDALVFDADWRAIALLSIALLAVAIASFAAVGRPWTRWQRTTYW